MGKLVLVRHGKTEYNSEKRFTGFINISISEEGRGHAQTVGELLKKKGIQFDAFYTSWLKRAWETLDIVRAELQQMEVPIIKHPQLNERHYGDLQGKLHSEIADQFLEEAVMAWRRSYNLRPPNGESLKDVVSRVEYYLQDEILPRVRNGENILICAHGNSNRAIVKFMEDVSNEEIVKREIAYDVPLIYNLNGNTIVPEPIE